MKKLSAGILLYRHRSSTLGVLEVLLVHPGGPYWEHKDIGAWSIPKGEYLIAEDPFETAKREFQEETSFTPPDGKYLPLGSSVQPSGKTITIWAVEGDCSTEIHSNMFTMEWPARSGKMQEFPEVDRAEWLSLPRAKVKIVPGQVGFLNILEKKLNNK